MNNLSKCFVCLGLLLAVGCGKIRIGDPKKLLTILDGNSGAESAQLLSASFTKMTTSNVRIGCGSNTHYMVSASMPVLADAGWTACSGSSFDISQNLVAGNNNLKYWFKDSSTVSGTSKDLSVWSGMKYIGSPDPEAGAMFAIQGLYYLSPTRILAIDGMNSHVGANAGGVFIYDNLGNLVKSIYGEYAGENFGGTSFYNRGNSTGDTVKLSNGNFAVVTPLYTSGANTEAGAVFFYNANGDELSRFVGDEAHDNVGIDGVVELPNGNVAIISSLEIVGGNANRGSVRLVNGTTGALITNITGALANDKFGSEKIIKISNGNFLINSPKVTVSGVAEAGSSTYVNGTTGAVIATYSGVVQSDFQTVIGTEVANGSFVLGIPYMTIGANARAGKAMLINSSTGAIVATIAGDEAEDLLSQDGILKLTNGNFVILSDYDNVNGINNNGSAKLVNATTGAVIATTALDDADDLSNIRGTALTNGNFAIASPPDDAGGLTDNGSILLINGSTGAIISTVSGDSNSDLLGSGPLSALTNGNFVATSSGYDNGAAADAGIAILINGSTGAVIASFKGNDPGDHLGINNLLALSNGNFLLQSYDDDNNGDAQTGSILLINGLTGAIISSEYGAAGDRYGATPSLELSNGHYLTVNYATTVSGNALAGEILEHDSAGVIVSTIQGAMANLYLGGLGQEKASSGDLLLNLGIAEYGGFSSAGMFSIYPAN